VTDAADHSEIDASTVGAAAAGRVAEIDTLALDRRAAAYAALLDDLRLELEADGRG
jgi:hypothetical protein